MSASSKKKLRKEQNAANLTEKQLQEKKEAKKLKVYSSIFVIVMLAVLITAVIVMGINGFKSSGIMEKNTIAATIGEHKINSVEMNYYYNDAVSSTYNEWNSIYGDAASAYMLMMGLDTSLPLDEQPYDESMTWADYFMDQALERAKSTYALYDMAVAEGFTLSEGDKSALDSTIANEEMFALLYGFTDLEEFLVANYGYGANRKSYEEYNYVQALASAYYTAYYEGLTYDDAALREYEAENYNNYTSFNYASYYLAYNKFLPTDIEGDPTEQQIADAQAAAKEAADQLKGAATVEEFDEKIAALEINAETTNAASIKYDNALYSGISTVFRDWLADCTTENAMTVLPYETTSTAEDGTETTNMNGYYAVMFLGKNENTEPMGNVRHLLVKFEGGTTDDMGNTVYSDDEKAAAKAEADGYLATWKSGEATEESFIALVQEHSDDTSASTGGLFEDINPDSQYVENFLNWSIDPARVAGDAEVIETEYGYHVMFYVGDDELSYRDSLITNDLLNRDLESWYNGIVEAVTVTKGDFSRVRMDLVLTPTSEEEGHEGHDHA